MRAWSNRPGGGQELAAGAWQKLEALPDPRSLRGRIYPLAGRYRAPDEKTIRVVPDHLDPRALARTLPPVAARAAGARGGPTSASVRGYPARQAAQQARALARGR